MPFRIWNRMWPDSLRFSHDLGCVALRITTMSTFGISRERDWRADAGSHDLPLLLAAQHECSRGSIARFLCRATQHNLLINFSS